MAQNRGCLSLLLPFLRPQSSDAPTAPGSPTYTFTAQKSLFSPAERSFYVVLLQSLNDQYVVFAKVRLCDVLKSGNRKSLNKISQKHVDFILCLPGSLAPVLAIELDDRSHAQPKRRERDEFVDQAFALAALPILHIRARRGYAVDEVAAAVKRAIGEVT